MNVAKEEEDYDEHSSFKDRLENLMLFLKKKVNNEDRISMAISGFDVNKKGKDTCPEKILSSITVVDIKSEERCILCGSVHLRENCQ